ncbi:MAG TPA: twin-arginine translocase TatA/TatE family subunit [Kiritimatiellia bacterium]|jgi:TatA/E family protein of Tat protein translocase|nr:twin-arginine translocase TatA/TatE family subunit [Kiritimatiellia bacterium]HOR97658.1 twin-arginine translocase TatA/TatE family subunit [Kiritimatiellia bacterium]HPC49729.1 twin-arginine translocase TatA/TatE family subunit [Kiritimatiellia bacterium]HPW75284.1 twin-arginine translocase TatA/TatE family subunit [Kiritimatiellia bacterium]HRU19106.1 twin-arginine translocase TatA/TatE family subunit [Kiritimatiellia bacterium]
MSFFPSVAFLGGSVGTGEWIVLFVVVLIVVGPKRLPEIARKLGRTMEMFRRAADEFKDQLLNMDREPAEATPPPETDAAYDPDGYGVPSDPAEPYDGTPYPDTGEYADATDVPGEATPVSDGIPETDGSAGDAAAEPAASSKPEQPTEDVS